MSKKNSKYDIDIGVLRDMPQHLQYLVGPAMIYGRYQFDDDIDEFVHTISTQDLNILKQLAGEFYEKRHYRDLEDWARKFKMIDHPEIKRLVFLFAVMDALGLKFN